MLLIVLQGTEQTPQQRIIWLKASTVLWLRNCSVAAVCDACVTAPWATDLRAAGVDSCDGQL
jgi:hypothetical protein